MLNIWSKHEELIVITKYIELVLWGLSLVIYNSGYAPYRLRLTIKSIALRSKGRSESEKRKLKEDKEKRIERRKEKYKVKKKSLSEEKVKRIDRSGKYMN